MIITAWSSWAGRPRIGDALTGPLGLIVIHHSYLPAVPETAAVAQEIEALRSMDRFHRVEQGWKGLGYNFCVMQSGRVYEGRGWLRSGSHTERHNRDAHGVCFVTDGSRHPLTKPAIAACRELFRSGIEKGVIRSDYELAPHDRFKNKVCPGDLIKHQMPELYLTPRLLKMRMSGTDVAELQRKLGLDDDGYFGIVTHNRVLGLQKKLGLVMDGIVGPLTLAALDRIS